MEVWASEVVIEDEDFILGGRVWFGAEMRVEREGLPPIPRAWIQQTHHRGVGGTPLSMTHLGKVVLFFSQGLRTGSGGTGNK